jgi:hypothetical protein
MLDKLKQLPELAALPLLIIVGLLFFASTNPANLPPAALMVGFLFLAGVMYCLVRLVTRLSGLQDRLSKGKYNALLVTMTALPVILVAMQSIGQLTVRDAVTIGVLFLVFGFYISRMSGES